MDSGHVVGSASVDKFDRMVASVVNDRTVNGVTTVSCDKGSSAFDDALATGPDDESHKMTFNLTSMLAKPCYCESGTCVSNEAAVGSEVLSLRSCMSALGAPAECVSAWDSWVQMRLVRLLKLAIGGI